MQKLDALIFTVISTLSDLQSYLKECRMDASFTSILKEAELIAKEMDSACKFSIENTIIPRKRKVSFNYEHADEY